MFFEYFTIYTDKNQYTAPRFVPFSGAFLL